MFATAARFRHPRLYQLLNIYNPATIDRFHMTTHTTLSAAAPAPQAQPRLEPRFQWHRHSCLPRGTRGLCAVARHGTHPIKGAASRAVQTLIANARLALSATHSKISPLQIPNRERMAISSNRFAGPESSLRSSSSLIARHSSLLICHSSQPF